MSDVYVVYILENSKGRFYVGQTDDVECRLAEHNDPERSGSHFTGKDGPWRLVWVEEHGCRADAMARERQIKRMKSARWIRKTLLGR